VELIQVTDTRFEILKLTAHMEDQQAHKGVRAGVHCGGCHQTEAL